MLENAHWLYGVSIVALLAVAAVGRVVLGGKGWIEVAGGEQFQVCEGVKVVLIIVLARYFAEENERGATLGDVVKAGAIALVPMLLVLKEPDLGTALTYVPVAVMALFLGGIQFRHAAIILLVAGVLAPALWVYGPRIHLIKQYQKDRLTSFLHPQETSQKPGYQLEQSKIAA